MNKFFDAAIVVTLTLVTFFLAYILIGVMWIMPETINKMPNYDYKINLKFNSIEIYREFEDDIITIHPDSLQQFIINDNL